MYRMPDLRDPMPSHVRRPTGLEYGFDYMLKPRIAYIDSYCNYECTVCSEVCPTHAIKPLTKEEKATTQVGIATFFINRCIVKTEGTDCGAVLSSTALPKPCIWFLTRARSTIPQVNPIFALVVAAANRSVPYAR